MRCVLACLVVLAWAPTAHAETKPQVSITTRAAEIAVTVDAALRKHPGLYENCLAEGRRWAERNRAEAAKELKESPELFRQGRRWTFERRYEIRSVIGRYVSVLRDDGTYQGGAHPNSYTDTILWDREQRRRMNIRPFFRETADNGPTMNALARLARLAVATEKLKRTRSSSTSRRSKLTPERLAELDQFIAEMASSPRCSSSGRSRLRRRPSRARARVLPSIIRPTRSAPMRKATTSCSCPGTRSRRTCRHKGAALFGGSASRKRQRFRDLLGARGPLLSRRFKVSRSSGNPAMSKPISLLAVTALSHVCCPAASPRTSPNFRRNRQQPRSAMAAVSS